MKKFLLLLLAILTCFCFLFGLSSCKKNNVNGTYYLVDGQELDKELYFKLSGDTWTDENGYTGTFTLEEEKIIFFSTIFGKNEELCDGTIVDGVLTVYFLGDDVEPNVYCLEGSSIPQPATVGLEYTLKNNAYYTISGIGTTQEKNIVIPDFYKGLPIKTIEKNAFQNCTSITSVSLGNNITKIGATAFSGCTGLTDLQVATENSVYYSEGNCIIEKIEKKSGCSKKTSNVLVLGCATSIIPNNVVRIADGAFSGCTGLTSITIPNNITEIASNAFSACTGLTEILVSKEHIHYASQDGILYNKEKTEFVCIPEGISGAITIPDGIQTIGRSAFSGFSNLMSITIGNGVQTIGEFAFENCSNLMSVTLGNSVQTIGDWVFKDCTNLTNITIGNSVQSIGFAAFSACTSLTNVTLGNSVQTIESNAFENCSNLMSVTLGNSVQTIGDWVFKGCTNLTNITIGNDVQSIGNSAFAECDNLKTVYYHSTENQWNEISIGNYNYNLTLFSTRYYYSAEEPVGEGNYWRYLNGEPTVW